MRNYKKYLAATLAMALAIGNTTVAFAAELTTASNVTTASQVSSSDATITDSNSASGTINSSGRVEGIISEDVFAVVVPTCIQSDASFEGFDFVLDPQKLITKTKGAKYATGSDAKTSFVEDQTLYFTKRSDGILAPTSEYVTVTNKSSIDVDVTLEAAVTGLTDITMSNTKAFADDSTSMYLALIDGNAKETAIVDNGKEGAAKANTAKVTAKIGKAVDAYEENVADDGTYEYVLKDDATGFETYEFALTGASNNKGDWSEVTDSPQVAITWTIAPTPKPVAPSIATKEYTYADADIAITVDLGAGDSKAEGIKSITFLNAGAVRTLVKDTDYTFANGTLTLKNSKLSTMTVANPVFTVTFDNDDSTQVEVTVKK